MEVGSILAPGTMNKISLKQWQPGERLLVEVVQKNGEGQGTIRVKGQDIFAILQTSTELGDKFWVKVGDIKDGNLLLVREPLLGKQVDIPVVPQQLQQFTERGLPNNLDILTLLKTFISANTGLLGTVMASLKGSISEDFMLNFIKSIPKWEELSEENGAEELVEGLRKLGLNYEQRIQLMLKSDSQTKEAEKNSLKETLKYALLQALQSPEEQNLDGPDRELALMLLQKITGQQLWLKSGAMDNAYMLLHLPLYYREDILPVQIAIESARKGSKMDEKHCRIAIQIETQALGDIGIDAYFNQDVLSFHVLTRDLQFLPQLLEEVMPETKEVFAKLGFTIGKVGTADLDTNLEFQNFLRGSRRSGVDIQR
ncbi:hypothetical protein [Desulfosporosinus sp. BICA1-9]|uniref:hypothetical protein n=1 Tax=Desulfosporosinus sp. BICA1-9 TaxID=1531958 RepID=UPI00054C656B|nr:hypothetical protein [Desulfosporosinus sp. BICA1-9]KJS47690.1 MAG: hypothetical protein VR66_18165 [Peptococcaceae bacterium BRH_c23]KJS89387.1 MAG: hypothetical protein JL57_07520 [Desulfosporosinus sp. BICA1-9]HBW36744.1 hypothetical protein [Desulfosporosinus sp.]